MGHYYRFKRWDVVTIVSGPYQDFTGVIDGAVFQRIVARVRWDHGMDSPPEYHLEGYW